MNWFLASLIAPFVWSFVNHADKLILSRYFHGTGSGGLMIFAGIVAAPIAILIAFYETAVLSVTPHNAAILIASGILYNVAVYFYLKVLEKHDASYVVPFWQLVPVCAYVFGILLLSEYMAFEKLFGGAIVIAGAVLLSTQFGKKRTSLDIRSIGLMTLSSATLALGYVLFKDADSTPFWPALFWNQVGMTIFGVVFFLIPAFRREFLDVIRENSTAVLGLNVVEQVFEIIGVAAANFAVLLAPAAMVVLVEYSFQPLFVFLFGIVFTLLFPKIVREDISRATLLQRIIAIAIMAGGLALVV
ncbi:MAG: EamA family transporter [Minisyncoccia bacterium]